MGEVVNLNAERKRRQRAEKEKKAAFNRRKHGRRKGERTRDTAQKEKLDSRLDQHALDETE